MIIFPSDLILKIKNEDWTYFEGDSELIKEDAPEKYKKAWQEWQAELVELTQDTDNLF